MRPGAVTALHCPYCYEQVTAQQLLFRCSGLPGRGSRPTCEPEADEVRARYTGRPETRLHAFPSNGQSGPAQCPQSGAMTTTLICPVCHSELPAKFGKIPSAIVALAGAKESGKTTFMTVLVHELMHRLGEQLDISISPADDHTAFEHYTAYEIPLYRGSQPLAPTRPAGTRDRLPLVFRLTIGGRRAPGRKGQFRLSRSGDRPAQSILLSFFDPAGEDLQSIASVQQSARYLAAAAGVVLLLDPLQIPAVSALAAPGTPLPLKPNTEALVGVLRNVTDLLRRAEPDAQDGLISKPLAITLSKMDAIQHSLRDSSPLRQNPVQTPCYDGQDSLRVHTEVRRLLGQWDGSVIDRTAHDSYRHYRYCAVSALGETPTEDHRVSPRGIRPHRIGSPLTWILKELGVIPVKRG